MRATRRRRGWRCGVTADDGGAGQMMPSQAHHVDDVLVLVVQARDELRTPLSWRRVSHLDVGRISAEAANVLVVVETLAIHGGPGRIRATQLVVHGAQPSNAWGWSLQHQMTVDVDERVSTSRTTWAFNTSDRVVSGHCSVSLLSMPWGSDARRSGCPCRPCLCTGCVRWPDAVGGEIAFAGSGPGLLGWLRAAASWAETGSNAASGGRRGSGRWDLQSPAGDIRGRATWPGLNRKPDLLRLAEGSRPMEPVIMAHPSERMSPNRLEQSSTPNWGRS